MRKKLLLAWLLAAAAPGSAESLLADFTNKLLLQKNPSAAFADAAPGMIQHNPAAAGDGRDAAIALTTPLFATPGARFTPLHLLADGDFVLLHYYGALAPGAGASVAEIFRVESGRLAEHWDAFMPARDEPGPPDLRIASGGENRGLIERFATTLYGRRDPRTAFIRDTAPGLVQHDGGGQGRDAAIKALAPMFADPAEHYTLAHIFAAGAYGALHVRAVNDRTNTTAAVIDILKIQGGRITEIWPIIQIVPAQRPNPRAPV